VPRRLLACLVVLGVLLSAAAPAPADVYFGATIGGDTYGQTENAPINRSAWDLFERHAGKRVAVLNMSQEWGQFDDWEMDATYARGTIPFVRMGLAEGVTLKSIASGAQDSVIRAWARAAKAWGHPFFLNPWWEMNGAWFPWGRDPNFVAAWRHFHDLVVAEGATNVTWTWVSNNIWSDPASDPTPYYPGSAYVDWTGIDAYNWGRNPVQPDRWLNPGQIISPTLERIGKFAAGKPVMIVEDASSEIGGNKADWIREMLTTYVPHHREIGAYFWFNWRFQKSTGTSDWQIESSAPAQQAFRSAIQPDFFRAAPIGALPNLTKVPAPTRRATPEETRSEDISTAGRSAGSPQVAVAADGTTTVVWSADDGSDFAVYSRRFAPDGTRGPVVLLSAAGEDALSPQVAVAPDGTATVVWVRSDGRYFLVQARRIGPTGVVGAKTENLSLSSGDSFEPQLAVARDGAATVVWKQFDGTNYSIRERRIASNGVPAGTQAYTISAAGQNAVEPQVAVSAAGTATAVWSRYDGSSLVVQMSRLAQSGAPSTPVNLSPIGRAALEPQIAIRSDGIAAVAWVRYDGANFVVQGRRIAANGLPGQGTSSLSAPGRSAAEPQVAMGPDGAATYVWSRMDGVSFVIQERRLSPTGVPERTTRVLSAVGRDAVEPRVAIAPGGQGTVAWSRFDGSNFVVEERRLRPDGVASDPSSYRVSAPGRSAGAADLAFAGTGVLTTVWRRFNGAVDTIQRSKSEP
jgi:phage terminase large subunit-like protein